MEKKMYESKETGELLTFREAVEQAQELYDYGDETNHLTLEEYYNEIIVEN